MSSYDRSSYKIEKKKKKRRIIFTWIILPIMVLSISAAAYGSFLFNKAESVMDKSYIPVERELKREPVNPIDENTSVLFIGVDDSELRNFNSSSRSDALMLATFNEKEKSVKLLSIPRDSYVYIPEAGHNDKITHAHAMGGVASTIETVEGMLDIPIDYYVKMNFNAFTAVIDALDGVKVNVPYALQEMDSSDHQGAITLQPGLQTLNGEEALALARTRKQDNDIERGKRQQEIIKAIISKATSAKGVTKYSDVLEAIGDNMTTDLSFSNMKAFIDYATSGLNLEVETLTISGADAYIDGIYYYQLDETSLEEVQTKISSHLELEDSITTESNEENDDESDENVSNAVSEN